jgi:hypothetical protein
MFETDASVRRHTCPFLLPLTNAPDGSARSCGKTAHALVSVAATHVRPWSVEVVCHKLASELSRNTDNSVLPSGLSQAKGIFRAFSGHF